MRYLVFLHLPDSTEQYLLPDLFRKFIMFAFRNRTLRYAAAAGGSPVSGGCHPITVPSYYGCHTGLLVTVVVDERAPARGSSVQIQLSARVSLMEEYIDHFNWFQGAGRGFILDKVRQIVMSGGTAGLTGTVTLKVLAPVFTSVRGGLKSIPFGVAQKP